MQTIEKLSLVHSPGSLHFLKSIKSKFIMLRTSIPLVRFSVLEDPRGHYTTIDTQCTVQPLKPLYAPCSWCFREFEPNFQATRVCVGR